MAVLPSLRRSNEGTEHGPRGFVFIHRTFRMPLDRYHEVVRIRPLQTFNDAVCCASSGDTQTLAGHIRTLVMTGIYRYLAYSDITRRRRVHGYPVVPHDSCQHRAGLDGDLVCNRHLPSRFVIYGVTLVWIQPRSNVLDQRTATINIQALQSVTDTENRLLAQIRFLEQRIIDGFTRPIRLSGGGMPACVESGGIDVGSASGKEHAMAAPD
jgi:hypothetical protein